MLTRPVCGYTVPSASVSSNALEALRSACCRSRSDARAGYAEILGFADSGAEENRVQLRHRREQRRLAAADEVARPDERGADQPIDGRGDGRVAEIDPRALRGRNRGLHLGLRGIVGRDGVVELLLADRLLGRQRREALDVVFGLDLPRAPCRRIGFGGGERGLQRPGVDAVEDLALSLPEPSVKVTSSRMPSTRARISTSSAPLVWPTSSRTTGSPSGSPGRRRLREGRHDRAFSQPALQRH